jgi:hypothetical protein
MPRMRRDAKMKRPKNGAPGSLESAVKTLVDDFVRYLDLWLFWPTFVQSVRFLLNQDKQILADVVWMFPEERDERRKPWRGRFAHKK